MKNITFNELLEHYFYHKHLREKTMQSYKMVVKQLLNFDASCTPNNINRENILIWREFLFSKGIAAISWNSYMRHLRALINFAIEYELVSLDKNPFSKMLVRELKKRKKTLSKKELNQIMDYLSHNQLEEVYQIKNKWFWLTMVTVYKETGIRLSQLLALKIKDIDLVQKLIFLDAEASKNHYEHIIPISKNLYEILTIYMLKVKDGKPLDQLFNINRFDKQTIRGRANLTMNINQITLFFRRLSYHLGFKVSSHRFRHTIATELMKTPEKNLYTAKQLLGHKSLQTTLGYIEYDPENIRSSVDAIYS